VVKVILREYFFMFKKLKWGVFMSMRYTMAFFIYRDQVPHAHWKELRERVEAYTSTLVNTNMPNPIVEVGDAILVHLHPDYADMLSVYEKNGFTCGLNYTFKVTRLFPWNHPADQDSRDIWKRHMRTKEQEFACHYFTHPYYDSTGMTVPPPPKLARVTNESIDYSYTDIESP
jgi:hypothetical protein